MSPESEPTNASGYCTGRRSHRFGPGSMSRRCAPWRGRSWANNGRHERTTRCAELCTRIRTTSTEYSVAYQRLHLSSRGEPSVRKPNVSPQAYAINEGNVAMNTCGHGRGRALTASELAARQRALVESQRGSIRKPPSDPPETVEPSPRPKSPSPLKSEATP